MPAPGAAQPPLEATLASPTEHEPSQSLVSRRAIGQIVRAAVAGSYGVTGLTDDRLAGQLLVRLGLRPAAIVIRLDSGIRVELRVLVAPGVPVAEVARQVDSAVRYSIRQALGREIDALTIHVGGLRFQGGPLPESQAGPTPLRTELAPNDPPPLDPLAVPPHDPIASGSDAA